MLIFLAVLALPEIHFLSKIMKNHYNQTDKLEVYLADLEFLKFLIVSNSRVFISVIKSFIYFR